MRLTEFHSFQDSIRWRLVPAGVEIENSGVERTRSIPTTVTRIWESYGAEINQAALAWRVPCALIIATICTESGGQANALRLEPGYVSDELTPHKVSPGLMQTLLSTAREALQMSFDRAWLLEPANSIQAGTAYVAQQARSTQFDPPLVAAAYNAGKLAYQSGAKNRWKLRQYPIGTGEHCDRFVRFFNDAVFVLSQHPTAPSVGLEDLLNGVTPTPRRSTLVQLSTVRSSAILSGANWVAQFPGSKDVNDLDLSFRPSMEQFIAALKSAGATISIKSTYRPPERAYLMHWSWMIVKQDYNAQKVLPKMGVNINWWHGDATRSKQAAQEMVDGYHIGNLGIAPSLTSRHIEGKAIDMSIFWTNALKIKQADGSEKNITSTPRDETNGDLIVVGKTYGVIHFSNVLKDKAHWSSDGK